jgi:hypothetical protein
MKRLNSIRKNYFDYLINKDVASVRHERYFSFFSVNNLHPTREFLFLLYICHRELASSKRGRKKKVYDSSETRGEERKMLLDLQ